jgi:phosphatidate phosphatase APP1
VRSAGLAFHVYYVSASPWQLYKPLASFLETNGFPPGIFYLKPFRFKNPEEFLRFFTERPDEYKKRVIAPVLERFRKRCFVLVGDSGEGDPAAYGELGRRYPDQVARIFIRDLKKEGRTAPRYRDAFKELPAAVWDVFDDPSTIRDALPVTCKAGQR